MAPAYVGHAVDDLAEALHTATCAAPSTQAIGMVLRTLGYVTVRKGQGANRTRVIQSPD